MNHIKTILLGFLGGTAAWFLFLSLSGNTPKEPVLALTPIPIVVSSDFWQKIVSDHILSTVAVQSFKGGNIIREGSGIVVSSDGIIITTFDVISGADVLQVFHKDKILRAKVMRYDGFKNLALLKVNSADMDVTRFDRNYQFQPGQDMVVSGKMVELSNSAVFAQRGMISYILSKDTVMDTEPNYFLSGSKVISNSGIVVGMSYLRNGSVHLITAETMDDFVKSYFQASEKQI
ncbi:MAG: hypothetical protein A2655_02170 [Candidatus Yanofskybacteria bacterium RIFCSPHIGHO2_01_FULL_43_42]|uniref:Serine protease n=1 Tax=Candidatus Yanofskybacteria bacterium RIFCSPLOWO2_01_FULL_43_22 TaxID=1802695 RepID=A0A1F8GI19_9BACT|nr:MAG: hypothetical protein A2655_02170 [Candidatus Yanofskybacteria bacterium RIFCSPHIGHO2_01_FULL_43_42]OGN13274.1 MAG: hypothetical protein A3D48_03075 [Candidatus Yanofskybacteria bacterium RIFCSPHIGHO2_02_FULL_43_17]OGN24690.1 MAG: hypothetical protein A3A13_01300 [Candidatus Yanofskybacteria bacterium RIFCSPLOWO2_01_FULL_43_22]